MKGYKNCGERDVTYFGYGIVEYAGVVVVQYENVKISAMHTKRKMFKC